MKIDVGCNMPGSDLPTTPASGGGETSSVNSGVKDVDYWMTHYDSNITGAGSITESINVYDEETSAANVTMTNNWVKDGVIYQTITYDDGTSETIEIGSIADLNGSTIDSSQIDFSQISTTANGALNGNFINADTQWWGNNGAQLTIQVMDNGAVLILENGVAMGWTTLDAILPNMNYNPQSLPSINDIVMSDIPIGHYVQAIDEDGNVVYCTNGYGTFSHVYTNNNGETFGITAAGNVIILNEDGSTDVVGMKSDEIGNYIDTRLGNYYETASGDVITGYGTFDANSIKVNEAGESYVIKENGNVIILKEDGTTGVVGFDNENIGDYVATEGILDEDYWVNHYGNNYSSNTEQVNGTGSTNSEINSSTQSTTATESQNTSDSLGMNINQPGSTNNGWRPEELLGRDPIVPNNSNTTTVETQSVGSNPFENNISNTIYPEMTWAKEKVNNLSEAYVNKRNDIYADSVEGINNHLQDIGFLDDNSTILSDAADNLRNTTTNTNFFETLSNKGGAGRK